MAASVHKSPPMLWKPRVGSGQSPPHFPETTQLLEQAEHNKKCAADGDAGLF